MTHQQSAIQPRREPQRMRTEYRRRRPRNREHLFVVALACIASLSLSGVPAALAKLQCHAAMPANPHGQWWSYRLIDGRKCWYEGKPMISKASLEWPRKASEPSRAVKPMDVAAEKRSNPLDSEAWARDNSDTFEALWRARIEQQR